MAKSVSARPRESGVSCTILSMHELFVFPTCLNYVVYDLGFVRLLVGGNPFTISTGHLGLLLCVELDSYLCYHY